jgi:hypothetical protein
MAGVVVTAAGLLLVGLYALHASWTTPAAAALGALVALGVSPWPGLLSAWGDGEALVALGFLLPAAALLARHASSSSAVAAGFVLAAGALAQPLLAAAAVLGTAAVALAGNGDRRRTASRLGLALGIALVTAAPGLRPLARALSAREALAIAAAVRPLELALFAASLLLAALAPLLFRRAVERRSAGARIALGLVGVLGAALLLLRVHAWLASGQLSRETRAALARAALVTGPLDAVCAADAERDFVPALAGRPAGEPGVWIPHVYDDEWAGRDKRACTLRLDDLAQAP